MLIAVRRLIDDEYLVTPFKSRQSAVNRDLTQFLSAVFPDDGVEFRNFLPNLGSDHRLSDSDIDNVLAILTGLSPLKLVETAKYSYITERLLVSSFEDPDSKSAQQCAKRCIKYLQDQRLIDKNNKYDDQKIDEIKKCIRQQENQAYSGALCRALDRASISSTVKVDANPHLYGQVQHLSEMLKQQIAARLLSKAGTLFVHDRDPLLRAVTQDLDGVKPESSGSFLGLTTQDYPVEKTKDNHEYDGW